MAPELGLHVEASTGVQRGQWLVEQQQRRLPGQSPGGWFDQLTISDDTTPEQLARPETPT
jgi:hypothetical protein